MTVGLEIRKIKDWQNHLHDFWTLHPSAKSMGALRKLHTSDTSKGKTSSSKKAWYCVLYCHPASDFYNLEHEDKVADLGPDLFPMSAETGRYKQIHEKLIPCIKTVENGCLSKVYKHIHTLYKKLEERDDLFATTPYTIQNAKILDDMIKTGKNLVSAIQECEDIIKQSAKDGTVKGDAELSMMESGSLWT